MVPWDEQGVSLGYAHRFWDMLHDCDQDEACFMILYHESDQDKALKGNDGYKNSTLVMRHLRQLAKFETIEAEAVSA